MPLTFDQQDRQLRMDEFAKHAMGHIIQMLHHELLTEFESHACMVPRMAYDIAEKMVQERERRIGLAAQSGKAS